MKINLGVIIYGSATQYKVNLQQISFWREELSGFNIIVYDFNKDGAQRLINDFKHKKITIVIKNAYGRANEARIESWLELNKIPFMGSNSLSTLVGTNKYLSKKLFDAADINTPAFLFINKLLWLNNPGYYLNEIKKKIGYPFMLKECGGTDSRGIYHILNEKDFKQRANSIFISGLDFIAEKKIKAKLEITCLVGGKGGSLVAYEPVGYEYLGDPEEAAQKKDKLQIEFRLLSDINKKIVRLIKEQSLLAHKILGCSDFSRADFLYDGRNLFIIEVDVHPGFRSGSATTFSIRESGDNLNDFFLSLCR